MQKTLLASAILASLAGVANVAQAADPSIASAPQFVVDQSAGTLSYSFSNLTLAGFDFVQITGFSGKLVSVSVNATLNASVDYTYADDLTIYVDPAPLSTGGLLQVGGFSSLSAAERRFWANGGSSAPGTTVIDTVTLTTPITFAGTSADPLIWLGNGYGATGTSGTWSGSITLTVAAVPEPATWALFAAGAVGLAGWSARRRRSADVTH